MYATVLLLNGFTKTLWYQIPEDLMANINIGTLVRVPIQKRYESAMVVELMQDLPASCTFTVKPIAGLEPLPPDIKYSQFIEKIAKFHLLSPLQLYARVHSFLKDKKCEIHVDTNIKNQLMEKVEQVILTQEQQAVVDYVEPFIKNSSYAPTLVHGVTGSGKTEVYKKLITTCIQENKSILILLPEVSLSLQFEHLFKKQLPDIAVFGFHSATMLPEKRALWKNLLSGKPVLILGVHLPVMLPISNLGLIIIDEEHEQGFIEKKHPKINSKEVALWRAQTYGIPIVLGSATPALSSLHNVRQGRWKFFQIRKRFSGAFPVIQKILLNEKEGQRRKNFWISRELELAIIECLNKKQQIIIYLNRRGYSFFVQCKNCGLVFECPHCSVSLTLHIDTENNKQTLRCHYCGFVKNLPSNCPDCQANQNQFLKKGLGTQQAVQLFKEIFPQARIERADMDSTSKKRTWRLTVEQFENGEIDMLIGTQTITKGYHFPGVTLVGVLWADVNLHFPVFNASEVALQQLIQVAGRAGRQHTASKVIVQTLQDHSIFNYLNEETYIDFCDAEFDQRKEIFYPPACRLVHLELRHTNTDQVDSDSDACAKFLIKFCAQKNIQVHILGPAKPLIARVANIEMRQIFLKSRDFKELHLILTAVQQLSLQTSIFVIMH